MDKLEAMQRLFWSAQICSFTKAADALGLPKSSISSAVQRARKIPRHSAFFIVARAVITLTQVAKPTCLNAKHYWQELDAVEANFGTNPDDIAA